jgi:hypothetical protein
MSFAMSISSMASEFSITIEMSTDANVDSIEKAVRRIGKSSYQERYSELISTSGAKGKYLNFNKVVEAYGTAKLDNLDTKAGANELRSFLLAEGADVSLEAITSELLYNRMVNSPQNWAQYLEEGKNNLSFEEKITFAARLGKAFVGNYDSSRAKAGLSAKGIVSIEEMLANLSTSEKAGICRDISLAQAQILTELGVNKSNIYQMAYNTQGGAHAIVMVQDPNDPNNIIKINYGNISESNGVTGVSSLDFNDRHLTPMGEEFHVFDSEGRQLLSVPTELGLILNEVSGSFKFNPNALKPYSIRKAVVKTKIVDLQIFQGAMSSGETVDGFSLQKEFQEGVNSTSKIGVTYIYRRGDRGNGVDIDQKALQISLQKNLKLFEKDLGGIVLYSEADISGSVILYRNSIDGGSNYKDNFEANIASRLKVGAQTTGLPNTYSAAFTLYAKPGMKSLAEGFTGGYTVVFERKDLEVAVSNIDLAIGEVSGKVIVSSYPIGEVVTLVGNLKRSDNKGQLEIGHQFGLDSDMPRFSESLYDMSWIQYDQTLDSRRGGKQRTDFYFGGVKSRTTGQSQLRFGLELKF